MVHIIFNPIKVKHSETQPTQVKISCLCHVICKTLCSLNCIVKGTLIISNVCSFKNTQILVQTMVGTFRCENTLLQNLHVLQVHDSATNSFIRCGLPIWTRSTRNPILLTKHVRLPPSADVNYTPQFDQIWDHSPPQMLTNCVYFIF